mgnify:CR=1 FL=1
MSQDVSELFSVPASGIKGIANLFVSIGTVIAVNPNALTCTVLSNQGLLENTRMTFPQISAGSGNYSLPNVGDICTIGFTVQGDPYITGYGAYDATASLKSFDRINPDYNSIVLTSNKRSMLVVSDDIHLTTMSGNHLLLNNNADDPAVVLEGSNRITIRTGVDPDASTIDIIKDADNNKTTLSIKPNGESSAALTFEFKDGKITMNITQELTVKVSGGDGTNFVTADQVKSAIDGAIGAHTHLVASVGNPTTTVTATPASLTGITNLKTESA